jgi:acyl carrier protein
MSSLINEVRTFIVDNFLFGTNGDVLSAEDSLIEKGLIDSTGVLELVAFIQETFQIRVEDHEIVPANLDSIGKIATFVRLKKGAC